MKYTFQFIGGLGDVLMRMHAKGDYRALCDLGDFDHAVVQLITANPGCKTLFDYHPKRKMIDVQQYPYYNHLNQDDVAMAARCGLPEIKENTPTPGRHKYDPIPFYVSPKDVQTLESLQGRRYVVVSASSAEAYKIMPDRVLLAAYDSLVRHGVQIVQVGKSFPSREWLGHGRKDRWEPVLDSPLVINLIDRLSVPGFSVLIRNSCGVVCAHTAANILGWMMQKPQLFVYPPIIQQEYIEKDPMLLGDPHPDRYGIGWPHTFHSEFSRFQPEMADQFAEVALRWPVPDWSWT